MIKAPATMTPALAGSIPGNWARAASGIPANSQARSATWSRVRIRLLILFES